MGQYYHENYFKSLNLGLLGVEYSRNQSVLGAESVFSSIKKLLTEMKGKKGRLFFLGNGASSAFSNHMALDFSKNGGISSFSLSDSAMITALANDFSYDQAMVEFLKVHCVGKDDVVVTISSSGNSSNIVSALFFCRENDITTIAFSGLKKENESRRLASYSFYVPSKTYGIVECIHQVLLHLILDDLNGVEDWNRSDTQNMNSLFFRS